MANAWNSARNLAAQAVALNRPVGNLAQEQNEANWNKARNVAGEVASIENRPPPGAKSFEEFKYKILTKDYTPEEVAGIPPTKYKEGGIGEGTKRDLIVKTLSKGTLLFTYSWSTPANPLFSLPRNEELFSDAWRAKYQTQYNQYSAQSKLVSRMSAYLGAFGFQSIWFNFTKQAYEICLAKDADTPKYFYPIPFAANGVNDYGPKYSFVVPIRLKEDIQVAFAKSGSEALETDFSHKGHPYTTFNYLRVPMCDRVSGCKKQGDEEDMCLATEFAASEGLAGICQISGQDTLAVIKHGDIVDDQLSRSMQNHFKEYIQDLDRKRKVLNEWDDDVSTRLQPRQNAEEALKRAKAQYNTNLERFKLEHKANYNNLVPLQEEYDRLETEYDQLGEQRNSGGLSREEAYSRQRELIKKMEEINEELTRLEEELLKPMVPRKQEVNALAKQHRNIQASTARNWSKNNRQRTYGPKDRLEAEFSRRKAYLDMMLLTLESDHRVHPHHGMPDTGNTSYVGFAEYVLHPFGARGYRGELFVPDVSEDGSYELDAGKSIPGKKQVVYVKPDHLEAFYQRFIAPNQIYEPLGVATSTMSTPAPPLTPASFPPLPDKGASNGKQILDQCMSLLLDTLRLPIAWDYRTNVWVDQSHSQATQFLARFEPSPTFTYPINPRPYSYPFSLYYHINLTTPVSNGHMEPYSPGIRRASFVKLLRAAIGDIRPKARRLTLVNAIDVLSPSPQGLPVLIGPFNDMFSPESRSLDHNTEVPTLPSLHILNVLLFSTLFDKGPQMQVYKDELPPSTFLTDLLDLMVNTPSTVPNFPTVMDYLTYVATVDETKPNDVFMGRYVPVQRAGRRKQTRKAKAKKRKQTRHKKRRL